MGNCFFRYKFVYVFVLNYRCIMLLQMYYVIDEYVYIYIYIYIMLQMYIVKDELFYKCIMLYIDILL